MMSKSRSDHHALVEPLKYEPVVVTPMPCTLEELDAHLRAFIANFIVEGAQARWVEFLIEKRAKWYPPEVRGGNNRKVYQKADRLLNLVGADTQSECVHQIKGADTFPLSLARIIGTMRGVYFDLNTEPCKMTVAEAATKATEDYADAIVSFVPGKKAVCFGHEGDVWLCQK